VGAARPRAHGHAMTSTVMKKVNASRNGLVSLGSHSSGITVYLSVEVAVVTLVIGGCGST
jgi:hypothetical protein